MTIDLIEGGLPKRLLIYLIPEDDIEIKIPKKYGSYIKNWDNEPNVQLYVHAKNANSQLVSYGPFDYESGLAGIYYENKDYTIQLYNDGIENSSFYLLFEKEYFPIIRDEIGFPITSLYPNGGKIKSLPSPLIFVIDKSGSKYIIYLMVPIMVILVAISMFTFS